MSDADALGLITIVLCLAASMFFSGSETAIMSYGERQARKLVEEGGREGKIMASWVRQPVRVLSTILVGNNLVNTLMGAVVTALAIRHLGDSEYAHWAVPIAVVVTTGLLLLFGEITPKALGRIWSERLAVPALFLLELLSKLLLPITWALTKVTNLMISRAVPEDGAQMFRRVTPDDIDYLVRVGQREGSIPADQAALLRGIFRFEDKIVRDIMVPRDRVTAIDIGWNLEKITEVANRSGHSRMPIFEGDLDNIKGVLHIKQLVGIRNPTREVLSRLIKPPMFISESLLIQDLLRRFKEQRVHLAIVVNDGGHTVGVVTLEDVLEQIVGQIFDESDTPTGLQTETAGLHYLDGQASLRRVEELFGIEFDEFDGVTSVGDLLAQLAGQIPTSGSVFVCAGVRFKVLSADDRRVIRVSVEQIEIEKTED